MNNTPDLPQAGTQALHPANGLAGRVAAILSSVTALIFRHPHILGALSLLVHNRIAGASRRLASLLARIAAGRVPAPRAPQAGRRGGSAPLYIPRRRGWLVHRFGYHAAAFASQLEHALADPATLAILAAAPPHALASAARILRPVCRLLGTPLPPILQPAPRTTPPRPTPSRPTPPRPARPPQPAAENPPPENPAPMRPLYPRRFAREMPPLYPALAFRRT